MGTLKIRRVHQAINMMRGFKILLDSKPVGAVADGETAEFSLDPGVHEVTAKIDWCRSPPVTISVEPGHVVELEVGCNQSPWGGLGLVLSILFNPSDYLYLRAPQP
jgi:hypothetical protein